MDDVTFAPARHRLTADEVHRMAEAGVFDRSDRIELIEGDLIDMAPIGQGHAALVDSLTEVFVLAFAGRAITRTQGSIRLSDWSMPEPDVAVLRRRPDRYATGARPGPADVLLLVEVADSSLHFDRTVKLPLYAGAGIAEFWLLDVNRGTIETYRHPVADSYAETATYRAGDRVALALAPDIVVTLDLVFP